jgi:hypothetical protein
MKIEVQHLVGFFHVLDIRQLGDGRLGPSWNGSLCYTVLP